MKLNTRDATRYFAKPDPDAVGLLIFGADTMRVALKRQEVIAALIGPQGEEEMRLTRIPAADLRKDPALLGDAIKAVSFFPGPRVALVEDATDITAKQVAPALEDWAPGDAQVIVTAGSLKASSALRKLFEKHPRAYAAGIYDTPPGRDEIEAQMATAGLAQVNSDAMSMILTLAQDLPPGDFRQMLEKLSLYKLDDPSEVQVTDVDACAPLASDAALDDILNAAANGQSTQIGPLLGRLYAQGTQPVALCIAAMRHFRQLHLAASDPGGAAAGIGRLRPPVFGPRRDQLVRQASGWGVARLEMALDAVTETDLTLRSAHTAPDRALVERMFIRLAMLGRRRG